MARHRGALSKEVIHRGATSRGALRAKERLEAITVGLDSASKLNVLDRGFSDSQTVNPTTPMVNPSGLTNQRLHWLFLESCLLILVNAGTVGRGTLTALGLSLTLSGHAVRANRAPTVVPLMIIQLTYALR